MLCGSWNCSQRNKKIDWKVQIGHEVQDGSTGSSWNHFLPDIPNLQLHIHHFPLKKIWNLDELLSTTKERRATSRWVGEAETWSFKKKKKKKSYPTLQSSDVAHSYHLAGMSRGEWSQCLLRQESKGSCSGCPHSLAGWARAKGHRVLQLPS